MNTTGADGNNASGTSNPDQLRANLAIAEKGPLPADLYERAKDALQPATA